MSSSRVRNWFGIYGKDWTAAGVRQSSARTCLLAYLVRKRAFRTRPGKTAWFTISVFRVVVIFFCIAWGHEVLGWNLEIINHFTIFQSWKILRPWEEYFPSNLKLRRLYKTNDNNPYFIVCHQIQNQYWPSSSIYGTQPTYWESEWMSKVPPPPNHPRPNRPHFIPKQLGIAPMNVKKYTRHIHVHASHRVRNCYLLPQ